MAAKRKRPTGSWEYIFRNKILPKPISLTFQTEEEGDEYAARLEALLKSGIVPDEFKQRSSELTTLGAVIRKYVGEVNISGIDQNHLGYMLPKMKDVRLIAFDLEFVERWVTSMKQESNLAPTTIRHYVGALGRCIDWAVRRKATGINPVRQLPKKYSRYTEADAKAVAGRGLLPKEDVERDRRMAEGEEKNARAVMDGLKPAARERPMALYYQGALECLFDLAVETAMRLREMYTLTLDQIDIERRTIFLDKTKNGSKRQVPLSTKAVAVLKKYMAQVADGDRRMDEFRFAGGRLFPWWDGAHKPDTLKAVSDKLSNQFSRIFKEAGCPDLRFHDLRHEATSRLFERTDFSDIEIAKITGHKTTAMLMRYSNLRASDLALRMPG